VGWVGSGPLATGLGWGGSQKMNPRPCLGQMPSCHSINSVKVRLLGSQKSSPAETVSETRVIVWAASVAPSREAYKTVSAVRSLGHVLRQSRGLTLVARYVNISCETDIFFRRTSCARGDTICLCPLQVDNIIALIRQVSPVPACWLFKTSLTFDLLTLKVVSESRVTWATSVPILFFRGRSVLELGPMYATDRRQIKASLNASAQWGGSIIIVKRYHAKSCCSAIVRQTVASRTLHGVVDEREVVLGARVEAPLEVTLHTTLAAGGLHHQLLLFQLQLTARPQSQSVGVTLGQHAPKVLLHRDHLHDNRQPCTATVRLSRVRGLGYDSGWG